MDVIAAPLQTLANRAAWFIRAKEHTFFHVTTAPEMRPAVLHILKRLECHVDNRSPFVIVDASCTPVNAGWDERSRMFRAIHGLRREALAKEHLSLPELPAPPLASDPLRAFALQVQQLLHARCAPLKGLMVILAPLEVTAPARWRDEVTRLMAMPELALVRWMAVEVDPVLAPLAETLGHRALKVDCPYDAGGVQQEMAAMLERSAQAQAGAPSSAIVGAAWPRGITPPPRRGQPGCTLAEVGAQLRAQGVAPGLAGAEGLELRQQVLRAAAAMQAGRGEEALRHQSAAVRQAEALDLLREAHLLTLVKGAYQLQIGHSDDAMHTFEQVARSAPIHGHLEVAAQAWLSLGAIHLAGQRLESAAAAYLEGAQSARRGGASILAIECLRMAGQAYQDARQERRAIAAWQSALEVAEALPPGELEATSIPTLVQALVLLLRTHGLEQEAGVVRTRFPEVSKAQLLGGPA